MITKQRLSLFGLGVIGVAAAWLALALFAAAWAHADVVVGGPLVIATSATSDGMALIQQYGLIWGGALLLWGSVSMLLRTNESKHWLAEGRTLAILTGAASVLGAVLEWRLNGGQLAGIIVTAIMALKLALSPAVRAATTPTVIVRNVTGPAALIVGAITFAAVFATPSCAEVHPRVAAATAAFVDCELPALKVAATEAYELAEAALLSTISGTGSIDSAALKRALVGIKSDGLRCAVAAAVAGIATPANQPQGLMAHSDATGMQAAYATVAAQLGWPEYRVR